ncbi:hypothetical protein JCM14469_24790 [Desulfatiferula olefinivorans]
MNLNQINQRNEKRNLIKEYYSVEIQIEGSRQVNQFVIYDMSASGLCLLVQEDAPILKKIRVGEKYRMKYYPVNLLDKVTYIDTQIRHITKSENISLSKHYLVGLSLDKS